MVKPPIEASELIADIDGYQPDRTEFAFWWLGQHSFIVKTSGAILYIDPYLSPDSERQVAPLLKPDDIHHASLVLGTHDHDDHIDRASWPELSQASLQARFIIPELLKQHLSRDLGIAENRFLGLDDQREIVIDDLKITGIAAAHEFLDQDERSGMYPYLGYVIENGCWSIYHAGDTCMYEGLQSKLKRRYYDTVLLPINGRDAQRLAAGCIGNMTYQEAADLAGVLKAGLAIPTHYDMFEGNTEDPQRFVDYMQVKYPDVNVRVPDYGQRVIVHASG